MIQYVTDYGALGDGIHDDTANIQRAMDTCAALPDAQLVFLPGTYLTAGLRVPAHLHMELLEGCKLLSCGDAKRCIHRPGGFERISSNKSLSALLYLDHADDVQISGQGVIDGSYLSYTDGYDEDTAHYIVHDYPRPEVIYAQGCKNLSISGICIQNSPFWTIHLVGCENTQIHHITIDNDLNMPNTDGIDVDRCRNTTIAHCRISTGDDGICPKLTEETAAYGDMQGLYVSDCAITSHSSAIKFGSSSCGSFRDAVFERIQITRSNRALAFQLRDGGEAVNIAFRDITLDTYLLPDQWWGRGEAIYITALPRDKEARTGLIQDVSFENIRGNCAYGIFVFADQPGAIRNIRFDHITLHQNEDTQSVCSDLRPCMEDCFSPYPLSMMSIKNAEGLLMSSVHCEDAIPARI